MIIVYNLLPIPQQDNDKDGVEGMSHQRCALRRRHGFITRYLYKPHERLPVLVSALIAPTLMSESSITFSSLLLSTY